MTEVSVPRLLGDVESSQALRVNAYAFLLITDRCPPFSLSCVGLAFGPAGNGQADTPTPRRSASRSRERITRTDRP